MPSLLRGFSAPVILNYPYTEAELLHLMAHDDDAFNRWEAGQRLAAATILEKGGMPVAGLPRRARRLLRDRDPAFAAEALTCRPRPSSPSRWRWSIPTGCTRRATRCGARSPQR